MSVTLDDLQAKNFIIEVKGVQLNCAPLKLSHALIMSKLGSIFENANKATSDEIKQAEKDLDGVLEEIIPVLKGKVFDMNFKMEVLTKVMESIQPDDNKELEANGVQLPTDPKA